MPVSLGYLPPPRAPPRLTARASQKRKSRRDSAVAKAPMDPASLARQRADGRRPYKVPATDGRRVRWSLRRVTVTRAEYVRIQARVIGAVTALLSELTVIEHPPTHE